VDNHRYVWCSLEFQPKMENWIYRHSADFLNYTNVLTNSVILLGLLNVPQNQAIEIILAAIKLGLRSYCDTSYSRGGVIQMWIY